MATEQNTTTSMTDATSTSQERTLAQNLVFGLKVWAGELQWMLTDAGRCWEVRQLEKRLTQEYAALGEQTEACLTESGTIDCPPTADMQRAAGQIQFLKEEIVRLTEEHNALAEQRMQNK